MSGLEKFQASDSWRSNLKRLLLMERTQKPEAVETLQQIPKFDLDIDEDLQKKLNEKTSTLKNLQKQKDMDEKQTTIRDAADHTNSSECTSAQGSAGTISSVSFCDDTVLDEDIPQWQRTSDESFEALERMCDKTASDPDSTLFRYLHSDNKEQLVTIMKNDITDTPEIDENDQEERALQRLLQNMYIGNEQKLEDESPLKGVEVTQLEDIEEPSRLWENTLTGDTILQTSPVKMVGLLRPSTIIEENGEESGCSNASSQLSFQSTSKAAPIEVSSSCYETAFESTGASSSNHGALLYIKNEKASLPSVSGWQFSENVLEEKDLLTFDKTFTPPFDSPESVDLLQFTPVKQEEKENIEIYSSDSEDSIIEIFSDDESLGQNNENRTHDQTNVDADQAVQLDSCRFSEFDGDKENLFVADNSPNKTPNFDDTMEEVDYILKKGLKRMTNLRNIDPENFPSSPTYTVNTSNAPLQTLDTKNTFLLSPNNGGQHLGPPTLHKQVTTPFYGALLEPNETKNNFMQQSPKWNDGGSPFSVFRKGGGGLYSPKTPTDTFAKPNPVDRFALNMRPLPKLDVFKKHTPSNSNTCLKAQSKDRFAHIVSPIGTYVKMTPTTPLMTNIKAKVTSCQNLNSTAFQELEHESRLNQRKFQNFPLSDDKSRLFEDIKDAASLPKKAYISSDLKQVVDERTPFTIPGGEKIQKYIQGTVLPAVVRHEGKLKLDENPTEKPETTTMTSGHPGTSTTSHIPRFTNSSMADLSLMSGDISMYTIVDARKF